MADIHEVMGWGGFEWDEGNLLKNWERHRVTASECEQVFFNRPVFAEVEGDREGAEDRRYALGVTENGRRLFVVFTIRGGKIRVISARDMSRRERKVFDES